MTDIMRDFQRRSERSQSGRAKPGLAVAGALGFGAGVLALGGRKLGMQMASASAGDWLRQLKVEHRMAQVIFETGLKTKQHQTVRRTALYAHLYYALLKHGVQEETTVYQALRADGDATVADELAAEHFEVKTYLYRLQNTPKNDPAWLDIWAAFYRFIAKHVAEEEEQVFPAFHERMTSAANRTLTLAMNRQGIKLA